MSQERVAQIDMLIRFFNMQAGTGFRVKYEPNREAINNAIEKANGDIVKLKNFIRKWCEEHKTERNLIPCFDDFIASESNTTTEEPIKKDEEVNATVPVHESTASSVSTAMSVLENAIVKIIGETKQSEIEAQIMSGVEQKVRDFIKSEYGTIERKVITVVDGKHGEIEGVQHEKFEQVVKFVANNEPVFLTGPAGSGKNVLCQQVAKALGLNFYFSNAVTQEYKITGFTDAMGVFHESQFYKAFKNGGLFMLDEMDASIPEVLIILNAALANRYFDFPAPIGYVEAHPDFRVIAAGNTFGLGANYEYVGRNQLDMASLDRFAMVQIDYSKTIENSIACGNEELVRFARGFRKAAEKSGVRFIVSYRAIGRIAKLESLLGIEETLKTCLLKSLEKDDISAIMSNVTFSNKYTEAVEKIKRSI